MADSDRLAAVLGLHQRAELPGRPAQPRAGRAPAVRRGAPAPGPDAARPAPPPVRGRGVAGLLRRPRRLPGRTRHARPGQIGRASCRERAELAGVAASAKEVMRTENGATERTESAHST